MLCKSKDQLKIKHLGTPSYMSVITQAKNRKYPESVINLKYISGTSLVFQWLRLCTPNAGGRVGSLVRELDPTCHN